MVKVLIVDNDVQARETLQHDLISLLPQVTETRVASSVAEARKILKTFKPGIVLLEIDLPRQTGFELLLSYKKLPFDVIFTTTHSQYAVQALRFHALDYLTKPIDRQELINALKKHLAKAKEREEQKRIYERLRSKASKKETKDFRLAVQANDGVFFFSVDEIVRLEADRNYTVIHFRNKRPFVASKTLKYFEDILARFNFVRTHKSHLVNPEYIVKMSNDNGHIILSDGSRIQVSRRKRDDVRNQLHID